MKKSRKRRHINLSENFFYSCIITGVILLTLFLFLNIVFSQTISPVYFRFMNDDQNAALSYLRLIRKGPQYFSELARLAEVYGSDFREKVPQDEIQELTMFQKLDQILVKNPYSRDILYDLFLLYDRVGNKNLAGQYLLKAKAVDPALQ